MNPDGMHEASASEVNNDVHRLFRLLTDRAARLDWADKLSNEADPSALLGAVGALDEVSQEMDRVLSQSVLDGRPPRLPWTRVQGQEILPDSDVDSDLAKAIWRAIWDHDFRRRCFGDARRALRSEGYELTEEELGKFRWFDHEALAKLPSTFEDLLSSHPNLELRPLNEADTRISRSADIVEALAIEHAEEVTALRAAGIRIGALPGEVEKFDDFDAGPPPINTVQFGEVIQLMRCYPNDLNAILLGSGYSLGRLFLIRRLLERRGYVVSPCLSEVVVDAPSASKWFRQVMSSRQRPNIDERLHQSPCHPDSVLDRVRHIVEHTWLRDREIAVLGDDDGVGLALAKYSQAHVHVFDLDSRLLDRYSSIARDEGLDLTLHRHDLRHPLPANLVGRFSLVSADPPQSLHGEISFLKRGAEALRPGLGHRIYCSLTPLWMGSASYHGVLNFMIRTGFGPREILKSSMEFRALSPLSSHHDRENSGPTAAFFESVLEETIHMGCDVHVFERLTMLDHG